MFTQVRIEALHFLHYNYLTQNIFVVLSMSVISGVESTASHSHLHDTNYFGDKSIILQRNHELDGTSTLVMVECHIILIILNKVFQIMLYAWQPLNLALQNGKSRVDSCKDVFSYRTGLEGIVICLHQSRAKYGMLLRTLPNIFINDSVDGWWLRCCSRDRAVVRFPPL